MKVKLGYTQEHFIAPADLERVFRTAFGDYRGRKFRVHVSPTVSMNDTYWDGGSISYYAMVRLSDGARIELPDLISGGYAPNAMEWSRRLSSVSIPDGVVVVRHSIFCGKDTGLTAYIRPDNAPPALEGANDVR